MDHTYFRKWTADTVKVTPERVVMNLRKDGLVIGGFELYPDGRISPTPPEGGRRVLVDQAAAARGSPVLALEWSDIDGWLVAEFNGHVAKLRSVDANTYEWQVDQNAYTGKIFGGLLFAQKAIEDLLFQVWQSPIISSPQRALAAPGVHVAWVLPEHPSQRRRSV